MLPHLCQYHDPVLCFLSLSLSLPLSLTHTLTHSLSSRPSLFFLYLFTFPSSHSSFSPSISFTATNPPSASFSRIKIVCIFYNGSVTLGPPPLFMSPSLPPPCVTPPTPLHLLSSLSSSPGALKGEKNNHEKV